MSDIHIKRTHKLGLEGARKLAFKWAEAAEDKLGMSCTYAEGKTSDVVSFTRPGADGELKVTKDHFELEAKLGFLLGMFRDRIEKEIVTNLDELLKHDDPEKVFARELEKRTKPSRPAKAEKHAPAKAAKPATKAPAKKKA